MAQRKVYLTVEDGGYTTKGDGEWVDFYVTSGGQAFGTYEPYACRQGCWKTQPNIQEWL